MATYLCLAREDNGGVSAVVSHRTGVTTQDKPIVRAASGDFVTDALLSAIGLKAGSFASSDDELAACIAVLRERPFRVTVDRRRVLHFEDAAT